MEVQLLNLDCLALAKGTILATLAAELSLGHGDGRSRRRTRVLALVW